MINILKSERIHSLTLRRNKMSIIHENTIGGGTLAWTTTADGITAYRTDLASGITAARIPYSAVAAESTITANLSTGTTFVALTATTVAE